jgi:hypothetical protein
MNSTYWGEIKNGVREGYGTIESSTAGWKYYGQNIEGTGYGIRKEQDQTVY